MRVQQGMGSNPNLFIFNLNIQFLVKKKNSSFFLLPPQKTMPHFLLESALKKSLFTEI